MTAALVDERKLERKRWLDTAAQWRYGFCSECGCRRSEDGKPILILVARAVHGRRFRCFDCSLKPGRRRSPRPATGELQAAA